MHPNISNIPFVEVAGLVCGSTNTGLQGGIDKAVETFHLLLLGQHGNVILEGIRNPASMVADVGDTLVLVPVGGVGQGFIEAIVEVFVVREDDVTADIEELVIGKSVI